VNIETNDGSHWREFDQNPLSHSMAHYLMAIDSLRAELGYARGTDVADALSVSRGAASMALSQLKRRGWVAEDPNRFLLLTDEGKRIANHVEHNFLILSKFFERVLGVDPDDAMRDACKMEHLISIETGKRLLWFMRYLLHDKDLADKVQERMEGFEPNCDLLGGADCPICEGTGRCLATGVLRPPHEREP
jgi:Mn-dependent DtxR family transcriptional regulator